VTRAAIAKRDHTCKTRPVLRRCQPFPRLRAILADVDAARLIAREICK